MRYKKKSKIEKSNKGLEKRQGREKQDHRGQLKYKGCWQVEKKKQPDQALVYTRIKKKKKKKKVWGRMNPSGLTGF